MTPPHSSSEDVRPMADRHEWGAPSYRFAVERVGSSGSRFIGLSYVPAGWEIAPTLGAEVLRLRAERDRFREAAADMVNFCLQHNINEVLRAGKIIPEQDFYAEAGGFKITPLGERILLPETP